VAAVQAVNSLFKSGATLCIAPQSVYEFWAVATRPVAARGLGLSIPQADGDVTRAESIFTLMPEEPSVYHHWRRLVRQYNTQGKPAHDARLVAFMLAHGITHLLTFNGADFGRYISEGITVVDPASVGTMPATPQE
jgi:predicted nucleic acid-binding protein